MVWDMSVHHLDNLVFCFGPVAEATARSFTAPWSQYSHDAGISAVLHFAERACCHVRHDAHRQLQRLPLCGAERRRRVGLGRRQTGSGKRRRQQTSAKHNPPQPVPHAPAPHRSEQGVIDDLYRYIVDDIEPGISGRNNLEILRACEMLCRSSQEQRTVHRDEVS